MTWAYLAVRLNGDGTEDLLATDLPLSDVQITRALSGTNSIDAQIKPEVPRLQTKTGDPIFVPWSTAIYAYNGGAVRGGILADLDMQGPNLRLDVVGFAGYLDGMPYTHEWLPIGIDPLDCARQIWAHVQLQERGNLGLLVDQTESSPVRLGKAEVPAYQEVQIGTVWKKASEVPASQITPSAQADLAETMTKTATSFKLAKLDKFGQLKLPFTVTIGTEKVTVGALNTTTLVASSLTRGVGSTTPIQHSKGVAVRYIGTPTRTVDKVPAEPYKLTWYETDDLGREFNNLAQTTPFDYVEDHYWDGDHIAHALRFGYPRIGRRRDDLRFVVGENVTVTPQIQWEGDDYASEVLVLGAGEGRKMVRGEAFRDSGRLRRVARYADKTATTKDRADKIAAVEVARRLGSDDVTELVLTGPQPSLGDEIRILGPGQGWGGDLDLWVRVLEITEEPAKGDAYATVTVRRADKDPR